MQNPCGLAGISFVTFAAPNPEPIHRLLLAFGFSRTQHNAALEMDLYQQGEMAMILDRSPRGGGAAFAADHGPSIPAMGWFAESPAAALAAATGRGAELAEGDLRIAGEPVPAVCGIGGSLIYFIAPGTTWRDLGFAPLAAPDLVADKGFVRIDHMTNNVPKGELGKWGAFYKEIFGFSEVRYFDIRGAKTGLVSYALRSPCGTFCIPINEGTEAKSQINEYLEEYKGPGIQHIAFLTKDILGSLRALDGTPIQFLDMDAEYYQDVFRRVPNVREDRAEIQRRDVLVDGDDEGYLLQIFTKNLIGPIFVELIQRENHLSFGEGNFGALFRSIERDQQKRGYLA